MKPKGCMHKEREGTRSDLQLLQSFLVFLVGLTQLFLKLHSLAIQVYSSALKPGYFLAGFLQLFLKASQLLLKAIELLQVVNQLLHDNSSDISK